MYFKDYYGKMRYQGEFKDGCFEGKGKIVSEYGDVRYEGEFKSNEPVNKFMFYKRHWIDLGTTFYFLMVIKKAVMR